MVGRLASEQSLEFLDREMSALETLFDEHSVSCALPDGEVFKNAQTVSC
jgi:hypothetical protein